MTVRKRTILRLVLAFGSLLALVILGLPAIQAFRAANRITWSQNNLKQIAIGLVNYNDAYAVLPLGADTGPDGKLRHGWQVRVLPFMESLALYPVDFNYTWDDPFNAPFFRFRNPVWLIPGVEPVVDEKGFALSHYSGNSHMFGVDKSTSLKKMSGGGSNVILAGEVAEGFIPWGRPGNWRDPALGLNRDHTTFGSSIPFSVQFVMCDGSVRSISRDIDPGVLKALASGAAGGQPGGD